MGVNGVTGDYSRGAAGFWIEKGQIAFPVSEMTIAGNLKDMFARLSPPTISNSRPARCADLAHRRHDGGRRLSRPLRRPRETTRSEQVESVGINK